MQWHPLPAARCANLAGSDSAIQTEQRITANAVIKLFDVFETGLCVLAVHSVARSMHPLVIQAVGETLRRRVGVRRQLRALSR